MGIGSSESERGVQFTKKNRELYRFAGFCCGRSWTVDIVNSEFRMEKFEGDRWQFKRLENRTWRWLDNDDWVTQKKGGAPTNYMRMSGGSGTWIADEEEARGSGIVKFGRCGRRIDQGFSESKNVDGASFSKISYNSIF